MEDWGGWFLFGLFAAILVWEEVWDLPQTAYLSSWLLLIITGGAVVCSAFFERRLWCRCRWRSSLLVISHLHASMCQRELRSAITQTDKRCLDAAHILSLIVLSPQSQCWCCSAHPVESNMSFMLVMPGQRGQLSLTTACTAILCVLLGCCFLRRLVPHWRHERWVPLAPL